ncbi:MAG: NAD(P)-binding domain-containing protein [Puniceicoccales bacterium]|jgi:L-lactate dehydrogenase|nr:NAD(P)-binding domain-containing protein [Puniceicoccales bacterium]
MKIGIIGTGNVGSAAAFLLATANIADEIVLINQTPERAYAEACDISHALPMMSNCILKSGDFADLAHANIAIISCGRNRGDSVASRLELLADNVHSCAETVSKIVHFAPEAILLMITNPVDVLAGVAMEVSKFPRERIISSGTTLDSARFVTILAKYFQVPVADVAGNVFGEHGDSQVHIWSSARIDGHPVEDFAQMRGIDFSQTIKSEIEERTKFAASDIIRGKQATCYGIAGSIATICRAIKENSHLILNVSTWHKNFENIGNVFLSTPTMVCSRGATKLLPLEINANEREKLLRSAGVIGKYSQTAMEILEAGPRAQYPRI